MQLIHIDPGTVDFGQRLREVDPDWTQILEASIRTDGVRTPIEVLPADEAGRYRLVAGAHRTSAALAAGLTEIPALLFDGDELQAQLREVEENLECTPEAWDALRALFLEPEERNFSWCYREVSKIAAVQGWTLPPERTLHRRMMEIPEAQRVLLRKGTDALKRMFPAQQRDRGVFHALEAVNADGHTWDVFVKWPDGTTARPNMVCFQDLYSAKILSWRVCPAMELKRFGERSR